MTDKQLEALIRLFQGDLRAACEKVEVLGGGVKADDWEAFWEAVDLVTERMEIMANVLGGIE